MGSCCLPCYIHGPRGTRAHTIDPLLTSCSNWAKTSHSECVWCRVFLYLHCRRGGFFGMTLPETAKFEFREDKLLNCVQRSTQPWILLFSLETLICNRSPLPLSPLQAYVITSSCGLEKLSYSFPTTVPLIKIFCTHFCYQV